MVIKLLIKQQVFQRCSTQKKPSNNNNNNNEDVELTTHMKRYIFPEERQQAINELRLVPKKEVYF